jgi:hypothetical protein
MRKILIAAMTLLIAVPLTGRAEWGWPPPNYSVTGVRPDGVHFRGLCEILRDRGWGWRLRQHKAERHGLQGTPAVMVAPNGTSPTDNLPKSK